MEILLSPKDRIKGLKLPTKITKDLAYVCGILAGDGCIFVRPAKHDYLIKCVGNPKDERELYHKVLQPLFLELFNLNLNVKLQDGGETYGFVIYSKALVRFFTEIIGLPCGRKDNIKIPETLKQNKAFLLPFIQGLADTDFCVSFKKKYKDKPYYPVISGTSKSKELIVEVSEELRRLELKTCVFLDCKINDPRFKKGYSIISRVELNGFYNLKRWMESIGFRSPKHLNKIRQYL